MLETKIFIELGMRAVLLASTASTNTNTKYTCDTHTGTTLIPRAVSLGLASITCGVTMSLPLSHGGRRASEASTGDVEVAETPAIELRGLNFSFQK